MDQTTSANGENKGIRRRVSCSCAFRPGFKWLLFCRTRTQAEKAANLLKAAETKKPSNNPLEASRDAPVLSFSFYNERLFFLEKNRRLRHRRTTKLLSRETVHSLVVWPIRRKQRPSSPCTNKITTGKKNVGEAIRTEGRETKRLT